MTNKKLPHQPNICKCRCHWGYEDRPGELNDSVSCCIHCHHRYTPTIPADPPIPESNNWEKEFVKDLTDWYRNQYGACACLGNCDRCSHHKCFGCACWILDFIKAKQKQQLSLTISEVKEDSNDGL